MRVFVHDLPNTLWGYDPDEGILFVSDAYPYTHDHEVGMCPDIEELPGEIRPEDTSIVIGRVLNSAHYVDAAGMMRESRTILQLGFSRQIAPAHGGVSPIPR